ncbi:MAG: hypothetical protein ACTFAL_08590 [Candidatus Electronema sp. V4]|uniref:hypothetical protein n=1 Tax=Candidatus Electronema sp. V4 TaxID=3454756 RepID=UPI004055658A
MSHFNKLRLSERLRQHWQLASHAAAVITDWLLIGSGLLLAGIALLRVDVPLAKWFILSCGLLFSGAGCRFRRQRRRRQAPLPHSARAPRSEKSV